MEFNVQILRGLATKGEGSKVGPGSPGGRGVGSWVLIWAGQKSFDPKRAE